MSVIAFIIPSSGRSSAAGTLATVAEQAHAGDIVCLIHDAPKGEPRESVYLRKRILEWERERPEVGFIYAELDKPGGEWGHVARNWALDHLIGYTHVHSIDDDDVLLSGAADAMHEAACDLPVIFRMRFGPGHPAYGMTLWEKEGADLQRGRIGTPMLLAPKSSARFGLQYDGDFEYVCQLRQLYGDFMWREEVICEVRPNGSD